MSVVQNLLKSPEPMIRLKTYRKVLGYDYEDPEIKKINENLKKTSQVIKQLFSYVPLDEKSRKFHVYKKWQGIHWILAILADIEYPPGDKTLYPSRDFEFKWLFSKRRWAEKPTIEGRRRFCASQEGNGLYSILKLGLNSEEQVHSLADRLIKYQWNDGGWNCDVTPSAHHSSYHESLIPMRALNLYYREKRDSKAKAAVKQASEVFLKRNLYMNRETNNAIDSQWIKLHYPPYWHYNILTALKVLAEAGKVNDPRCKAALDLLESKILPDGGFPAEIKYYNLKGSSNISPVDWGGIDKNKSNKWVTIDAIFVLKEANRMNIEI